MLLQELQGFGVTEKMVAEDFDYVEGFLAGAKASLVQELNKTNATAAAGGRRVPTGVCFALFLRDVGQVLI